MDRKLTDSELEMLRRCREDLFNMDPFSCQFTARQVDDVRRLCRETDFVEWRSNEARTGYGYSTSEAGREILAALKAQEKAR